MIILMCMVINIVTTLWSFCMMVDNLFKVQGLLFSWCCSVVVHKFK